MITAIINDTISLQIENYMLLYHREDNNVFIKKLSLFIPKELVNSYISYVGTEINSIVIKDEEGNILYQDNGQIWTIVYEVTQVTSENPPYIPRSIVSLR